MKRRTILAGIIALPIAALANTAHALGFRRRRCCEPQGSAGGLKAAAFGGPYKQVYLVELDFAYEGGGSGMETYTVSISADVGAENGLMVREHIREVKVWLYDTDGNVDGLIEGEAMTEPSTPTPIPIPPPPPPAPLVMLNSKAGTWTFTKSGVMLAGPRPHRAWAIAYVDREDIGRSAPEHAPPGT